PSVISGNRGAGIHASQSSNLTITGTYIGTDVTGTQSSYLSGGATVFIGNGSDGVFLEQVPPLGSNLAGATITDSIISGNRSNGIELLDASAINIVANMIGTGVTGVERGLGNAGSGIFVNQSNHVTIGGTTTAEQNIVSGNQVYGIALSAIVG